LIFKEYEMSNIVSQHMFPTGTSNVVATVVKLVTASDTVNLPRMLSTSGEVSQIRRSGDPKITISQTDAVAVVLTGNPGAEVLLVSLSGSPIPTPDGAGA
jgi:hypothetical protein